MTLAVSNISRFGKELNLILLSKTQQVLYNQLRSNFIQATNIISENKARKLS